MVLFLYRMTIQFGDRLRVAREAKRLSQERLGELVGKDRQQIIRWEAGKAEPKFRDLERLAEVLGVKPAWFFEDGDANPAQEPTNLDLMRELREVKQALRLREATSVEPGRPGRPGAQAAG